MNQENSSKTSKVLTDKITLDALDNKILQYLQEDGTLSLRELARKANCSLSAIKNHHERLYNAGVIKAVVAIVDCCKVGYHEMIIISIRVNNNAPINQILSDLQNLQRVNCIYQISGNFSILCLAKCIEKDQQIQLLEEIKKIPGIEEIATQVVLKRVKEDMRVAIPNFSEN